MLGSLLRSYRLRTGLTISQLARTAGISRQYLSDIEAGKRLIGVETFLGLTDLLTVPRSEWLGPLLALETRLRPLLRVADRLIDRGDFEGGLLALKRVQALSRVSRRYQGHVYHLLGLYTYASGKHGRALHWFRLSEVAATRSPDLPRLAEAYYNSAMAHSKANLVIGSVTKFRAATLSFLRLHNRRMAGYALLSRANVLLEIGSYHEAQSDYHLAAAYLREDAWSFDCKLGEAICLWQTRSPKVALHTLLGLHPNDPSRQTKLHHNLAVLYRQLGATDIALSHLESALLIAGEGSASISAVLTELCLCQVQTGSLSEARSTLDRFDAMEGPKDTADRWAAALLSSLLGRAAASQPLPKHLKDNYERRVQAAICLLLARGEGMASPSLADELLPDARAT